ncbi:MAG: hypothetical protein ACEQR5_06005 [Moraxellaceae bacterium]
MLLLGTVMMDGMVALPLIYINSGITQTAILWNKTRGVREVYVYYTKERAEAVTEKLKYVVDHPKVWILKLD